MAEHVVPLVRVPEAWPNLLALVPLRSPGKPWMTIQWPKQFADAWGPNTDRFATGVVEEVNEAHSYLELYGKGVPQTFAVFFTVEDTRFLYFPTRTHHSLTLPATFHIELYLEVKDLPLLPIETYQLSIDRWDASLRLLNFI
jgi:hypothetical protein